MSLFGHTALLNWNMLQTGWVNFPCMKEIIFIIGPGKQWKASCLKHWTSCPFRWVAFNLHSEDIMRIFHRNSLNYFQLDSIWLSDFLNPIAGTTPWQFDSGHSVYNWGLFKMCYKQYITVCIHITYAPAAWHSWNQGSNSWSRPTTDPVYTVGLDNLVRAYSVRLVVHEPRQRVRVRSLDLNNIGSV